jgi:hypothetical protein
VHLQAFAFSAATFVIGTRRFVVTNPLRTPGPLASDTAHEIAHVLLEHDLAEIREIEGVPFCTCHSMRRSRPRRWAEPSCSRGRY